MTNPPLFTTADVALAAEAYRLAPCPVCGRTVACRCLVPAADQDYRFRAVLMQLAAAGRIAAPTTPPYVHHLLDALFTGEPLDFGADGVPLDVQRRLAHARADGRALIGRAIPADERPVSGHVVAVAGDGAWEIEHPADCAVAAPTGPAVICLVHDLAVEQMPAAGLPPGRWDIEANDIGDRLRILERLHDDQCTPPVCAACGCWCHDSLPGTCYCEDPAGRLYGHAPGTGRVCGNPGPAG
ncbi:hypothetical protein [Micromonospora sp. RTGN7]|uniref:hypothetical protein n=1 Tax=Micromonospora sp. RTGN7 TaxID=3016526 RepID=UPI0029FF1B22|nr:hypothetical protein [Micromonospora sp. RTGN7]